MTGKFTSRAPATQPNMFSVAIRQLLRGTVLTEAAQALIEQAADASIRPDVSVMLVRWFLRRFERAADADLIRVANDACPGLGITQDDIAAKLDANWQVVAWNSFCDEVSLHLKRPLSKDDVQSLSAWVAQVRNLSPAVAAKHVRKGERPPPHPSVS